MLPAFHEAAAKLFPAIEAACVHEPNQPLVGIESGSSTVTGSPEQLVDGPRVIGFGDARVVIGSRTMKTWAQGYRIIRSDGDDPIQ